jgi:hypothetical protein
LALRVGEAAVVDVELTPGGIRDAIQVTTDVPLIEVERTQQANSISSRQVENLPNVGRNFQSYVPTLPGVANSERSARPACRARHRLPEFRLLNRRQQWQERNLINR